MVSLGLIGLVLNQRFLIRYALYWMINRASVIGFLILLMFNIAFCKSEFTEKHCGLFSILKRLAILTYSKPKALSDRSLL